ncbi:MAG TPA: diacylglycerol kinase family protein [Nocardioidaceae bacterium]|nr:diacylglycerol kinase family protein [Nocardioidaceae bacterium]
MSAPRSFHFLVNPASGGGTAPAAVLPVARILRDAGARVEVTYSPGTRRCRTLVAEAVAAGQVVVAVGGDGMVASLAGSVVEAGGVLGIVPCGRGNDFARQLGIGAMPDVVACFLLDGEPRSVDVVDVDGRIVVGSLYAGVDSLASELVDGARWMPRAVQYPYAAVRALLTCGFPTYRVVVDGVEHRHVACTVVVANSGYYGSGMHIAPDASLDDGLLDVVVVGAASRLSLIRSMPKLYAGTHVELEDVTVLRGREVSVSAASSVTAYGDGEQIAPLPLTVRVRPGALAVLA